MSNDYIIEDGIYGKKMVLTSAWSDKLIDKMQENGIIELYLRACEEITWKINYAFNEL